MTPFYQDSKGVIYCGDCIQIMHQLQANSVDAVVADPPYSSGGLFRSDKNQKPSDKYMQSDNIKQYPEFFGDNRDAHSWSFWSVLWISEAARLLKDGGYFFMFSDWRQFPNAADVLQAGGLVSWLREKGPRKFSKLVVVLCTAAFAGLLAYYITHAVGLNDKYQCAISGIAGYGGGTLLDEIIEKAKEFIRNKGKK